VSVPTISGFTNLVLIGRGGSASVYRAHQTQLERDVALKVLRPTNIDDRTRQLFDAERRLLGQLPKHQNIVTVFDSGFTNEGDPFLAMELCASGSVAMLLKRSGPLPLDLVIRVGHRMMSALDFAHRRGMIHRDVKPENILVSDLGEPVLSDFGIASVMDSDGTATDRAFSPHHVAPEILRGAAPAVTADLYSLGSTLFTLLTGRTPHQKVLGERLPISQILSRVSDPYYPIDLPNEADLPRELRNLLRGLLSKDPNRRVSHASEALDAFRRLESELGLLGRELPLPLQDPMSESDGALERTSDVDPDATYIGRSATPATTGPSAVGRTSRSSSVAPKTSEPLDDGTRVAPRRGTIPTTPTGVGRATSPVATTAQPTSSRNGDRSDTDGVGGATTPQRRTAVVALLILLVALAAVAAAIVRRTGDGPVPSSAVNAPETSVSVGMGTPSDIVIRDVTTSSLTVWFRGDPDPNITYTVDVMRGSAIATSIDAEVSPVVISVENDGWVPCVVVAAVDRQSGIVAAADPVCASAAPVTTTAEPLPLNFNTSVAAP
jgi:serine/threonine-protein kinase PknK